MAALTSAEIYAKVKNLPGWYRSFRAINKKFTFNSFPSAIEFVNRVAAVAERAGHHPHITVNYNVVKLTLSTESENGVTQRDFDLARELHLLEEIPCTESSG